MRNIDFTSPEFLNNPYPFYRILREDGSPCWVPHEQRMETEGLWLFSSYAHTVEVLKASHSVSKRIIQKDTTDLQSLLNLHMLNQDPPDHTRLRNLVAGYFSPRRIKEFEPRITQIASEVVGNIRNRAKIEFIGEFATVFPLFVIAEMMGVPREDMKKIRTWSLSLGKGFDSTISGADILLEQKIALQEFENYLKHLVAIRRQYPGDDLISALISAHDNGSELSERELYSMCILLLFAGHETTVNLFGNGLLTLFRHPDQFALLKKHPEYLSTAVEEILRFESPTQRTTYRITTEDCEIGGKKLHKGEQFGAILGAANRDPALFPEPDKFDIRRVPNRHLAFGLGIHICLGITLARTEAHIGFRKLLEDLPNMRLVEEPPAWRPTTFFRGLRSLSVYV